MKKYEIIGHCNSALSIILDAIKFIEQDSSTVDTDINIVSACTDDFLDASSIYEFNPNLSIRETTVETWDPEPECFRIIAAMDKDRRKELFLNIEKLFDIETEEFDNLIHPLCYRSSTTKLGHGIIVAPHSTLSPFSAIGNFTYINSNTSIGHHTIIREFCSIAPGVNIAGKCLIENDVIIGIGANILDGLKIGENSIVGAGAVVTKDLKSNSVYYGVPAKFIRKNRENFHSPCF